MHNTQAPISAAELRGIANRLRCDVIKMLGAAGSGHPGGSLSAADIVTALFFRVLRQNQANPTWPDRDRFILSKGHAVPILYAALAERGFIPKEWLARLRRINSPLQGHPSVKDLPAVEASTGSLGQGLSIGLGMALAARLDSRDYRVYVLIGDGESEEGQVWEAAMAAAHYKADNLTAILDQNRFQLDGSTAEIMDPAPQADKWRAFGWHVIEIDGHDMDQVVHALETASAMQGKPAIIIANTVKGKGVSFMENNNEYHGKAPTAEQVELALAELGGAA
jgi:transketolase